MASVLSYLVVLVLSAVAVSAQQKNYTIIRNLTITTDLGPVRGGVIETLGSDDTTLVQIGSFLGINFAKVPTGEFRFAHPVFTKWDFVQDAVTFDPMCYQDPGSGDFTNMAESCIAANIWTPFNGTAATPASYPVLIWIHGGRFESGSIADQSTSGRVLTARERIVTVSLQYRLGVLGFLRLSSTVAPGNMGLKDQALGLEFMHNNIEKFGGNLQTVTLMGIDAGAASVGYHMLNEKTRGFFKRAIMLGGSPMVFWAVRENTADIERLHLDFAVRQLGCPTPINGNFTPILTCLRDVSPEKLVTEQGHFNRLFQGIEFPPVIDNDYIKEDPIAAFRDGRFEGKSLMIGVTNAEAGIYVERSLESLKLTQQQLADKSNYSRVIREQFKIYNRQPNQLTKTGQTVLIDRLTDFGDSSGEAQYQRWLQGASDRIFVCAANEFADRMHSKVQGGSNEIYYYVFSEQDGFTVNYKGASHGQDANYFFGNPSDDAPIVKPEQKLLSVRMMDYLAKFVALGDPVPNDRDLVWARFNSTHKSYHNFSTSLTSGYNVHYGFRRDDCGFWDQTLGFVNPLVEPQPTTPAPSTTTTPRGTQPPITTPRGTQPPIGPTCGFVFNQPALVSLCVLLPSNVATGIALAIVFVKYNAAKKIMPV